jgi:hypothetical protein
MKKSKENKTQKKTHHNVETPTPPQVMDPSVPPVKKEEDKNKPKKENRTPEKTKGPEKLTPAEEL